MSVSAIKSPTGYSKEFKLEAVKLAIKNESVPITAKGLGISDKSLYRWVKEYQQDSSGAFPGKGQLRNDAEEIRKLRLENKRLKETNDILKKAAGYFAIHCK